MGAAPMSLLACWVRWCARVGTPRMCQGGRQGHPSAARQPGAWAGPGSCWGAYAVNARACVRKERRMRLGGRAGLRPRQEPGPPLPTQQGREWRVHNRTRRTGNPLCPAAQVPCRCRVNRLRDNPPRMGPACATRPARGAHLEQRLLHGRRRALVQLVPRVSQRARILFLWRSLSGCWRRWRRLLEPGRARLRQGHRPAARTPHGARYLPPSLI